MVFTAACLMASEHFTHERRPRNTRHALRLKRTTGRRLLTSKAAVSVSVTTLTWGERLSIIDALSQVLDGVYAHLALKRSLYGFDVVRGLEHLRMQLPTMSDLQFHRELTSLINHLRDAHTQYTDPGR